MPPTVFRIAQQALALVAIRLSLAAIGLGAAILAGAGEASAGAGLAFGASVTAIALVSDRRWLLTARRSLEPLPSDAVEGGLRRAIGVGLLPSTVGVTILLAVSLAFEPVLAAVLAGVLGGMGLVSAIGLADLVLSERRDRTQLFADARRPSRRFVR